MPMDSTITLTPFLSENTNLFSLKFLAYKLYKELVTWIEEITPIHRDFFEWTSMRKNKKVNKSYIYDGGFPFISTQSRYL